jgi:hypothetical protein
MRRVEAAGFAALLLAGCASLAPAPPAAPVFRDPALTVQSARDALAPGRSRKAEVEALLGPAEALRFDSGWEVWAYRAPGERRPDGSAELVLLFDTQGVLRKARALAARVPPG